MLACACATCPICHITRDGFTFYNAAVKPRTLVKADAHLPRELDSRGAIFSGVCLLFFPSVLSFLRFFKFSSSTPIHADITIRLAARAYSDRDEANTIRSSASYCELQDRGTNKESGWTKDEARDSIIGASPHENREIGIAGLSSSFVP